jgi:hypothetical protein
MSAFQLQIVLLNALQLLTLFVGMSTYVETKLFPLIMFHNPTFLIIRILIVLNMHVRINKSRDSSVGMAMSYGLDGRGSILGRVKRFLFIPQRPDRGLAAA